VAKSRQITLRFPLGGVDRRLGFQAHQPFTTPAALNVYPDDCVTGRARGGSRPGLSKANTHDVSAQYQFISSVNVNVGTSGADYQRYIVCGAGGHLYYSEEGDTTWNQVLLGPHTNPDLKSISVAPREQKLYIADYASVSGTDLAIDSGYNRVVTSASLGDPNTGLWSDAGITAANATSWTLEILSGSGGTVGSHAVAEYLPTFTDDTITVTADAGGSIVEKSDATPPWPAWAAAGSITFLGNTYTVKTRTDNDTLVLDNTVITAPGGTTHSLALLNTQLLLGDSAGTLGSTAILYRLHRVPKIWDLTTHAVSNWTATVGTTPVDCSLLCEFRDRMVLGRPIYDPHQWFASRSGEPLDFEYGVADATAAVAYSNYLAGQIGEPLTALIPHGYDCLVLGAEDAIYVLKGDPANRGSQLIKIDDVVGVLGAKTWCKTAADETVLLTRDGLYYINSGCGHAPISISREKLPLELIGLDLAGFINLCYDPLLRCVHIWTIGNDSEGDPGVATCWLYNWEQKAFWPVTLPAGMQPTAIHDFAPLGTANKSSVILGGYDGIARQFDKESDDDDGTNFTSYIRIGPFMISANSDSRGVITKMRNLMGASSGDAVWGLGAADTMEGVVSQLAADQHFQTGTVSDYAVHARVNGHAGMLEIGSDGSDNQWTYEETVLQIREAGRIR
jgi:hypothetical protein